MSLKIVVSCGPIPSKLDAVKYITNRFHGGLALRTAEYFLDKDYEVTVVQWKYAALDCMHLYGYDNAHFVRVEDVMEYYKWFEKNACNYDAFIMAAAVANLMPVSPFEGKFPSHNYSVGEEFDIRFTIAPRAIDIIKQKNPRVFLVGYKLFDADTDEELIEIAQHTLRDSKANIIFANRPDTAKSRKIALLQDGSTIPMSFDDHLAFMQRLLEQEYFRTEIVEIESLEVYRQNKSLVENAFNAVRMFEKSVNGYGTIAIKITDACFVTTSRGHTGDPVLVTEINVENRRVSATGKATLNAPAMYAVLQNGYDFAFHRHKILITADEIGDKYLFPGTVEEYETVRDFFNENINSTGSINIGVEKYHGYIKGIRCDGTKNNMIAVVQNITGMFDKILPVDWNCYREQFPDKYFKPVERIDELIRAHEGEETLEIGGNKYSTTKYVYDPCVSDFGNAVPIGKDDFESARFSIVACKNSINYLTRETIETAINSLNDDGVFIANTFDGAPPFKVSDREIVFTLDGTVHHFLIFNGRIYYHTFYNRTAEWYEKLGFTVEKYGKNSLLVSFHKNPKF